MTFRRVLAATLIIAAGACSKPAPQPSPPPPVATPAPAPAPAPPPVSAPSDDHWRDVPATPGDWAYGASGANSFARFGTGTATPRFSLACTASTRQIILTRHEATGARGTTLTVRAERSTRALSGQFSADRTAINVALPASDPLLAAMAFSRGRFAVEAEGLPTLYVPAWPEVTRVIEDCL